MKKFLIILALPLLFACETEDTGSRCGATCKDGTYTSSTGSGTCSGHGGVKKWNYCN